jgi:hypothetical protein
VVPLASYLAAAPPHAQGKRGEQPAQREAVKGAAAAATATTTATAATTTATAATAATAISTTGAAAGWANIIIQYGHGLAACRPCVRFLRPRIDEANLKKFSVLRLRIVDNVRIPADAGP